MKMGIVAGGVLAAAAAAAVLGRVPWRYKAMYAMLQKQLTEWDRSLTGAVSSKPIFAGELLPANCNRGKQLLDEQAWTGTMIYLDKLQELGVQAAVTCMSYPLGDEHVGFYKRLGEEVRRRGMKLVMETSYVFPQAEFGGASVSYSGLTWEKAKEEKKRYVQMIIKEVQPDYLTFLNEPGTAADLTGLTEFLNPVKVTEMVGYVLDGLEKQQTLVGAGSGTWDKPAYIESLAANTEIDYIDLHIYPVNRGLGLRANEYVQTAHKYDKRVLVSEAWLYKAADAELGRGGVAAQPAIFGRDTYGFWAPLDSEFLQVLAKFARKMDVELVSPFWTKYFFAYLPYSLKTAGMGAGNLLKMADQVAEKNIDQGNFSLTGEEYRKIIRE